MSLDLFLRSCSWMFCYTDVTGKRTWVQPAAEREAAVLLVKREGVHLQTARHHRLHGPVVPHRARGVNVDVGDRGGLPLVNAGDTHTHDRDGDGCRGEGRKTWLNLRPVGLTCTQVWPSYITVGEFWVSGRFMFVRGGSMCTSRCACMEKSAMARYTVLCEVHM